MSAVTTKEKPAAVDIDHKALEIDPSRVAINYDGFIFRSIFVRLPEGFIADDLKDPGIWRKAQNSPRGLRKFDQLVCVSFDESWMAEAVVAEADGRKAVLGKPRLTSFGDRFEKLFSDETYRVEWMGSGYVVIRKADGARVTQPVASAAIAERELVRMHPRPL